MKGNNELHLNQATVMEALQEYLNRRMGEFSPLVVGIQAKGDVIIVSTSAPKE